MNLRDATDHSEESRKEWIDLTDEIMTEFLSFDLERTFTPNEREYLSVFALKSIYLMQERYTEIIDSYNDSVSYTDTCKEREREYREGRIDEIFGHDE